MFWNENVSDRTVERKIHVHKLAILQILWSLFMIHQMSVSIFLIFKQFRTSLAKCKNVYFVKVSSLGQVLYLALSYNICLTKIEKKFPTQHLVAVILHGKSQDIINSIIVITFIIITRPKLAYGRQGLVGDSLRASSAQLGSGKWCFFVTDKQTHTSS